MASGNRPIRFKIFALLLVPLASLIALWGFAASVTLGDGLKLLNISRLDEHFTEPSTALSIELQNERLLTAFFLSTPLLPDNELSAQKTRTNAALADLRGKATSPDARAATTKQLIPFVEQMFSQLDKLSELRSRVETRSVNRLQAVLEYNKMLDTISLMSDQIIPNLDISLYQQAHALAKLNRARDIMSREHALISGAIIEGRLSLPETAVIDGFTATRRYIFDQEIPALESELRNPYDELIESPIYRQFSQVENAIGERGSAGLPRELGAWRLTADAVLQSIDRIHVPSAKYLADRSLTIAIDIGIRIAIAGFLGLVAVITSIFLSVRFGRRIILELASLRDAALELAVVRLPRVVDRLKTGEDVNIGVEAPPISLGNTDEIRDVGRAFTAVQRTAIEAAVGQAKLHKGVSQVFLNLARRNQSLLHRQLTQLDGMQRKANEPEVLDDLFRLDHLTTRMRRHAEGLIILSGATPGRGWRKPVPLVDVLRGAVAEVEDYTRVTVAGVPRASLVGPSVADVIHLVAELVENATIFSPPHTQVTVRGEMVGNGFAVEIEDRGLGMSHEEFVEINNRLANPPEFDLADSDRLGLFVVGRLAERHAIRVVLRPSPYGGTTSIVLIPHTLIVNEAELDQGAPEEKMPELEATPPILASTPRPTRTARSTRAVQLPSIQSAQPAPNGAPPVLAVFTEASAEPQIREPEVRESEAGETPAPAPAPPPTHAGLPRRVRQANLAPQLRQDERRNGNAGPAVPTDSEISGESLEVTQRSPEEASAMLTSFQKGWQRGRIDAEREGDV
ncbi:sensor histidine kinase [Rhizohabitans arisaemae]|uniref:sensor histidine kinase n=1 Tax=Rhizohabitans arisaemae TaxID=2720610 RepID=UPI0024B15D66|nr:nitrate- and nitrite sensing domain-containing protein [Rhizohabitans arisaemae]